MGVSSEWAVASERGGRRSLLTVAQQVDVGVEEVQRADPHVVQPACLKGESWPQFGHSKRVASPNLDTATGCKQSASDDHGYTK